MLYVIYEAVVLEDRWEDLKRAFALCLASRPHCILASDLAQDLTEPTLWRMFSTWSSEEAFKTYTDSATVLPGVYIFHHVDTEPSVYLQHIHLRVGAIAWPNTRRRATSSARQAHRGARGEAE